MGLEKDEEIQYQPRSQVHPKEKLTLRLLVHSFDSIEQPEPAINRKSHRFRTPEEWAGKSRYGAKRRAYRLKVRKRLLFIKYSKRFVYTFLTILLIATLVFWAKFAFVYNIPYYLQSSSFQNVQAYVVYKSWWFGPPSFNLGSYQNLDPADPELSLIQQLERYQDIITNPNEIILIIPKNTNNFGQ